MKTKCELVLERDTFTKDTTLGKLYFNGEFLCHTLENSYKANNRNTSSIPTGLYDVRVRTSAESGNFKYVHLLIEEVPKRSYILFHVGNTHKDTSGCILTGMDRVGAEMITNSLKAVLPPTIPWTSGTPSIYITASPLLFLVTAI